MYVLYISLTVSARCIFVYSGCTLLLLYSSNQKHDNEMFKKNTWKARNSNTEMIAVLLSNESHEIHCVCTSSRSRFPRYRWRCKHIRVKSYGTSVNHTYPLLQDLLEEQGYFEFPCLWRPLKFASVRHRSGLCKLDAWVHPPQSRSESIRRLPSSNPLYSHQHLMCCNMHMRVKHNKN